ncbi:hypothetical protein NEOLEDRAFT_1134000 [Neolentinus lepideus HHB14362 ss-1]|uniref:F-box domain-containing protein n=1 Tax=Neolentinus lepideus HHB14362 ss-1 TaxID=1314782 RepID=A0A165SIA3_9AGAM|nr:hypothetical protein NEOLEDRAFT_1134000 [Neolentinus lepideus HHB14362 ss-1]
MLALGGPNSESRCIHLRILKLPGPLACDSKRPLALSRLATVLFKAVNLHTLEVSDMSILLKTEPRISNILVQSCRRLVRLSIGDTDGPSLRLLRQLPHLISFSINLSSRRDQRHASSCRLKQMLKSISASPGLSHCWPEVEELKLIGVSVPAVYLTKAFPNVRRLFWRFGRSFHHTEHAAMDREGFSWKYLDYLYSDAMTICTQEIISHVWRLELRQSGSAERPFPLTAEMEEHALLSSFRLACPVQLCFVAPASAPVSFFEKTAAALPILASLTISLVPEKYVVNGLYKQGNALLSRDEVDSAMRTLCSGLKGLKAVCLCISVRTGFKPDDEQYFSHRYVDLLASISSVRLAKFCINDGGQKDCRTWRYGFVDIGGIRRMASIKGRDGRIWWASVARPVRPDTC